VISALSRTCGLERPRNLEFVGFARVALSQIVKRSAKLKDLPPHNGSTLF